MPGAGRGYLSDHITPAILPGTVPNTVLGMSRRPQAETIVVLTGEDQARHTGRGSSRGDLIGVEIAGLEDPGTLVTEAPLPIGKSVHAEVEEAVELMWVPL